MPERTPPRGASAPPAQDPYAVLGVARDADAGEIARAFRRALRRTHPDMGGSADEFAAVQAAWRVVGDPDERALYDAPTDEWAFDDWGVAVGDPQPDRSPPTPAARPAPPADLGGKPVDITTPFAAGAVPLPDPDLRTPRAARVRGLWWADRCLRPLALAAGAAMVPTVIVGNLSGGRVDGPGYAAVAFLGLLVLGELGVIRGTGGHGLYVWAFTATALSVAAAIGTFGLVTALSSVLIAEAALGVVAVSLLLVLKVWRVGYANARRDASRRVGYVVDRHQLASEWNLVREALRTPGSSVERLVDCVARGQSWRWTCLNPLTGQTRTRDLEDEMMEDQWIVFDRSGEPLAVAPPGSPEAWKRVLRTRTTR